MTIPPPRFVLSICLMALAATSSGCLASGLRSLDPPADLVFYGDHILTVDSANAGARAVAVRGETIVAVGARTEVAALVGPDTRVVELGERALTPGFIDAHGHLAMVMMLLDLVNASSPPVGPMESIDDIVAALRARIVERKIPPGELVVGYGYDDSLLEERRHPTRDDLDRASREHPIILLHVSAHLATANSAGLAAIGYDASTPDPAGGVIRRRAGSLEPNGVLEETAAVGALANQFAGGVSPEQFASGMRKAIAYHARFGITTIQDGASSPETVAGLRALAAQRPLEVDVAAYLHDAAVDFEADEGLEAIGYSPDYRDGVRVAGVKFVLDGSPQGRTAWLTRPYREGPPGQSPDYKAYPIMDPERYRRRAARLIRAGIPILAHANGDAAIDLMIEGVAGALRGAPIDHRSVAIHAQLTRPDQLDAMAQWGIIPSFFAAHSFFWGDWHRLSFGDERAMKISPARSAIERGLRVTIHNDAPVVPPDVMRLLEIAVDRRTRAGVILGADERIDFEQALRAVTLDAAYSYFEEDRKGSISVGKQADLVVLAADPRELPTQQISDVEIVETLARGRTVYRSEERSEDRVEGRVEERAQGRAAVLAGAAGSD